MSLPRYPTYKDSGVDWLGEVPGHWGVLPIKRSFRIVGGSTPKSDSESLWAGDILWATPTDLSKRASVYISDTERKISTAGLESCAATMVPKGSIILSTRAPIGSLAIADAELCTNQGCKSLVPSPGTHSVYFAHLLNVSTAQLNIRGKGTTFLELSAEALGAFATPTPPFAEQAYIAAFLDREAAKIDALVAEQQRLIELLQEKRRAVISHAVTKGLNPAAPMKDSGIAWLGEVPRHWEILRGSQIGTLFGSEPVPEESVCSEGDLPFIKVGSMSLDSFAIESWNWFVDDAVAGRYRPRTGYVVFPKRGAAIFSNKVNIVDRPSLIDPNLMGWQIGSKATTRFVAYVLKCRKLDELADVSTVPQINNKHIAPERFPIPPLGEQRAIVACLDSETAKLDTLTAQAQRAIDLLQERRTALISAAVTGQIDVRPAAERASA